MITDDMELLHHKPLPSFALFEFPTYKFKPIKASHLGLFNIKGILKNYYGEIAFSFYVSIDNEAPTFI